MGDDLLPTPTVADVEGGRTRRSGKRGDEILSVQQAVKSLLPTPTAGDAKSSGSRNLEGSKAHDGVSLTDAILHGNSNTPRRTSPSSPASEDSTSPSRLSGSSASAKSSGTSPAAESLSDGGRLFPDGETSESSPLLPTPDGSNFNEGQTTEAWRTRKARERAKKYNGNGGGTPIAMAIKLIAEGIDPNTGDLTSSSEDSPASPPRTQGAGAEPRMTAGFGPSSPVWLASWDPDTSSWRTSQGSLLSTEDERFPRSSERWPRSGMTRRGQASALPTPGLPTDASGSSSSLNVPTPTASDAVWADRNHSRRGIVGNHNLGLVDWARQLPTPAARDFRSGKASPETMDRNARPLNEVVEHMLPTPKTPTGGSEKRSSRAKRGSGGEDLEARLRSLGDPTPPPSNDGSES